MRVLILGGGPAGLAAAHRLTLSGVHCIVLEKEKAAGGLSRTIQHNGFRFDLGPHRWYTNNPELDLWFKTLMQGELVEVNRKSSIYFEGTKFDYPVRAGNILQSIGILSLFPVCISYFLSCLKRLSKRTTPSNMEDAYIRQFGKKLYEMFFKHYSEKIWGDSCKTISSDWVDQRTFGLSVFQIIRKALGRPAKNQKGLVEPMTFSYPRFGYGRISERMAEEICEKGGSLLLNHAVSSVDCSKGYLKCTDEQGNLQSIDFDAVISTIPLTLLIRMLQPAAPEAVSMAVAKLKFRSLITINIMLDCDRALQENWIYLNDHRIPFARLTEPKNFSKDLTPSGKTLLVAELFCDRGDQVWKQDDAALKDLAIQHLKELNFIGSQKILGVAVCRLPHAYPVYDLEYQKNLKVVQDFVATIPNLFITGRSGAFHYHTSDVSLEMGFSCVEKLLAGRLNTERIAVS